MAVTYLDQEIESLVQERKPAPADWRNRIRLKPKRGHDEEQLDLTGDAGNEFRLIFRQNKINPLDFSGILAVRVPGSSQIFRLRRYNGKSHEHTNHIEDVTFYDFHIHIATGAVPAARNTRGRLCRADRSLWRFPRCPSLSSRRRESRSPV